VERGAVREKEGERERENGGEEGERERGERFERNQQTVRNPRLL
jgi:hypothetical protein